MTWKEIGGIKSTTSRNRVYSLEANEDGELRCSCPAFIHSFSPKWCKHADSAEARDLLRAHLDKQRPRKLVRVKTIARSTEVFWGGAYRSPVSLLAQADLLGIEGLLTILDQAVNVYGYITYELREAFRGLPRG